MPGKPSRDILAPGTLDGEEATKNTVLLIAYSSLGGVYRELGLYARAGAMLDKFEKMLSTDAQPRRNMIVLAKNRGLLAYKQGEYAHAAVYLEKADGDQQLNLGRPVWWVVGSPSRRRERDRSHHKVPSLE